MVTGGDTCEGLEAVTLLERAAVMAGSDPGSAARLAVTAAQALDGAERYDTLLAAAQLFIAASDWRMARSVWEQAVVVAADDAARVRLHSSHGNAARLAGLWAEAESAHRRAVALAVRACGADSAVTAAARHDLAMTLKYTGGFAEAEQLYRLALGVAMAGGDVAFAAVVCHNLGGLAHARGRPGQGVVWARKGLGLRESLAVDVLALASDEGALAALLIDVGQYDEAEVLLSRSGAAFAERLGAEHYEVAVVNGNLAAVLLARGDLVAAESRARLALAGKERALGQGHPELAPTLTTLGTICRRRGGRSEAISLHERALEVLCPHVEPGHPLLATIRANLDIAMANTRADDSRQDRARAPAHPND